MTAKRDRPVIPCVSLVLSRALVDLLDGVRLLKSEEVSFQLADQITAGKRAIARYEAHRRHKVRAKARNTRLRGQLTIPE